MIFPRLGRQGNPAALAPAAAAATGTVVVSTRYGAVQYAGRTCTVNGVSQVTDSLGLTTFTGVPTSVTLATTTDGSADPYTWSSTSGQSGSGKSATFTLTAGGTVTVTFTDHAGD